MAWGSDNEIRPDCGCLFVVQGLGCRVWGGSMVLLAGVSCFASTNTACSCIVRVAK